MHLDVPPTGGGRRPSMGWARGKRRSVAGGRRKIELRIAPRRITSDRPKSTALGPQSLPARLQFPFALRLPSTSAFLDLLTLLAQTLLKTGQDAIFRRRRRPETIRRRGTNVNRRRRRRQRKGGVVVGRRRRRGRRVVVELMREGLLVHASRHRQQFQRQIAFSRRHDPCTVYGAKDFSKVSFC